jgi:hypothetical protein
VRKERFTDGYKHLIRYPKFVAKDGYIEAEDREQRVAWLEQSLATAKANVVIRHCEDLTLVVFERRQKFLCERHNILCLRLSTSGRACFPIRTTRLSSARV